MTLNTWGAVYGGVTDELDAAPLKIALPAALPNRSNSANASFTVGGSWSEPTAWVATTSLYSPSPLKPIMFSHSQH